MVYRVLFLHACVHCVSGYDFIDLTLHDVAKKVHSSCMKLTVLYLNGSELLVAITDQRPPTGLSHIGMVL